MNTILKITLGALLFVLTNTPALAQDRGGNANESIALVKKAVDYIKNNGRDAAFAEFKNPKGAFRDRALYIIVFDMKGTKLADGVNQRMIGGNLMELKDMDGKFIVKEFIEIASGKGKGWVEYKWPNPITEAIEPKVTYIEKFEDLVVGCGFYPGFFSMGKKHLD